ncbi:MAG: sodium/glutamate symporter [Clostridium sp.]
MLSIKLDMFQACALGALVYCLGRFMVKKISFLNKYCIPAPVAGGIVFALLHLALYAGGILELSFDTTIQTILMTVFFCSVGFTACFRLLKKGGIQVFIFLGLAILMCVIQDVVGSGLAAAFGLNPLLGLCMGSMPLVGGHGTSGSFGPLLEESFGVNGALTVALAAATYGLVSGSMMGGPIARARIEKLKLKSTAATEGNVIDDAHTTIDGQQFTNAAAFLAVAIGIGTLIFAFFKNHGLTMPAYIGAMLCAAGIRNIWDMKHAELPMEEIDALGGLSLNLYLAMAMMGLKLWQLAALALPMVVILLAQTVVMFLYANFVVFNVMGRDYESAAMTTAFCGFGMGATPNAMANMKALAEKYGAAPRAFFIVPLVGSLFVDFFNSMILTTFMNIL